MKKLILLGIVLVCILLTTAACSSGSKTSGSKSAGMIVPATTSTATLQHSYGLDKSLFSFDRSGGVAGEGAYPPGAPAPTMTMSFPNAATAPAEQYSSLNLPDRMVVRTGNIQIVVNDISSAMSGVANLASRYNGYVVTSQQGKQGERNVGSVSIRIAAENFEKALSALRGLAKSVTFESTSSQDVTEEYVDLDAKEKNLEATESQLRKIMEGATKTEDILSIQRELTNVRTNIEQAKGRMQYLERTTSTSLIQVQLEEAILALKFTANKISVTTDETIQFTSEVAGGFPPYGYQWDFGDGKTSNEVSPSHAYKDQGVYFVSLKVTDDKGYTNTLSREAYVNVLASWKPGSVASSAWNGLAAFGRVLVNVLIWLGIFSPVWIIIGGIIWWSIWRRKRNKA